MRRCFAGFLAVGIIVVGLLPCRLVAAEEPAAAEDGEIAPIESLYRLEQLPRLLPVGSKCEMTSSYDRTGGNDDGFKGTYSKLRVEDGNAVVAEMKGAGCIERIHLPHSLYHQPGLLGLKGEHIRIYLDGSERPSLDVPLEDIFKGKVDGFPKPLVGEGSGGHYCYVPIPYRNGCKVVFQGTDVKFYAVVHRTYPSAEGVVTFVSPPTARQRKALAAAMEAWDSCINLAALGVTHTGRLEKPFDLAAGQSVDVPLPAGPEMIRAIYLMAKPEELQKTGGVRLTIRWDDAEKPAVDVPLDFFFCQAMQPGPFRSVLVGTTDAGVYTFLPVFLGNWYNFMPMPYGKSARMTLTAKKPFAGQLTIVPTALPEWNGKLGYFHAVYNESLPTKKGVFHPWLNREGRGHFIGVFQATDGRKKTPMPGWLEGDEWFTCDGQMRIHGTGTEDGFNCGWYAVPGRLNGPCAFPMHGFTIYDQKDGRCRAAMFRWYLPDPVPYEKSIEAKIEHGGMNDFNANYRSVAFFYDAAP
jgi:hypothetical protein